MVRVLLLASTRTAARVGHAVTADTFTRARIELADLPCRLFLLDPVQRRLAKLETAQRLGPERRPGSAEALDPHLNRRD
jgi:hypothetical protein